MSQNFDSLSDSQITITHKVPTLNELATGHLNSPLGTTTSSDVMPTLIMAIGDKIKGSTSASGIMTGIAAAAQAPLSAMAGGASSSVATYNVTVVNPTASTAADANTLGHVIGEAAIQRMRNSSSTLDRVRS